MQKFIISLRPYARYAFFVWLLIIIILSSIPSVPTLKIHVAHSVFRLDYLMHFCEYGILSFLAFLAVAGEKFSLKMNKLMNIATIMIIIAIFDELHQKLIPGRSYNIKDVASDITGIIFALLFCKIVFNIISKDPDTI
jgi:polysaccharide biosynthesis protein VpsQ